MACAEQNELISDNLNIKWHSHCYRLTLRAESAQRTDNFFAAKKQTLLAVSFVKMKFIILSIALLVV